MQKFSPHPFQKPETGSETKAGDGWTVLGSLVSRNLCAETVCKSFLLKTCHEKRLSRAGDWGAWRSMPGNPARDALPEFKIGEKQRWCVTVTHLIETLRLVGRNGSGDSFHLPPDLFVPFLKILKGGREKGRKQADGAPKCAAIGIYSVSRAKLHGLIFPFRASCVIVCPGPTLCPEHMSLPGSPIFWNFGKASRAGFPGIERQACPISCIRSSLSSAQHATVFCGENFCKSFPRAPFKNLEQGVG